MLTWLEDNGYPPPNSSLTDISYRFEICSTEQAGDVFGQPVQHHHIVGIRGGASVLTCE